jgi:hypothetical protein
MREIQYLIEQGKQHGCFCNKSAAKDPARVADLADPLPSDRVSQIAATSSGHAAIVSLFLLLFQRIISYRPRCPGHASRRHQPPPRHGHIM